MEPSTVTAIVVGILTATGGGLLGALATGFFTRGVTRANAEAIATNTTLSIIKDLREEVTRLVSRLENTERESEEARNRAEAAETRATRAEYDVVVLSRGMRSCQDRIQYLTRLLEQNGISVSHWTPPEGIERQLKP